MSKLRIYLAGPDLFFPDARARYGRLKSLCAERGLDGVAPTDGQPESFTPDAEGARLLYRHDIAALLGCDAVLANITPHGGCEPDSGTAYEVGFAAAHGLPVAVYCLDGLTVLERARKSGRNVESDGRDGDGLLVEDFGLPANLMLCAEHPVFPSPELAVEHLAATLADRDAVFRFTSDADRIADLAMLVQRLARDLRQSADKAPSASDLPDLAIHYLKRHGLMRSPLREIQQSERTEFPDAP